MDILVSQLNKIEDIKISKIEFGTNIYNTVVNKKIDLKKMAESLRDNNNILIGRPNPDGIIKLMANESLLRVKTDLIVDAFKRSISEAK